MSENLQKNGASIYSYLEQKAVSKTVDDRNPQCSNKYINKFCLLVEAMLPVFYLAFECSVPLGLSLTHIPFSSLISSSLILSVVTAGIATVPATYVSEYFQP